MMMKLKKYLTETIKYLLRSYPIIRRKVKRIFYLYTLDEKDLNKYNEKLFLKIFYRAYDKSPFYHKLYTEAGIRKEDIKSLKDIKKLPVITKDMVREHADEMRTVPRWMLLKSHTSGSTGSPLQLYDSFPSIWMEQAYTYCARKINGFTYGEPLVSLRGHLDSRITHIKVHINNTLYLSSYNISRNTISLYYNLIIKYRPKAIEGYPSSLYSLALFLKDAGLKLHIPLTFTSSETLLDFQRELIEEQLGTEIFDNYGMTEKTIYLQESKNHTGYYELPGYSINEYVQDGEICTSLINSQFPLIRYYSHDIVELADANNEHPKVIVKQLEGRKDDVIRCKDGGLVQQLSFVLKGVNHVKCTQMVQNISGFLEIRIVPDLNFTIKDQNQIEKNIIDRIGSENIDFAVRQIAENEIQYTKRGKFKYLINMNEKLQR